MEDSVAAVILAAGQGKRMGSTVPKQFLMLDDKPLIAYTLETFQQSNVDELVIVIGSEKEQHYIESVVLDYHISKPIQYVEGGQERYHSVFNGLMSVSGCPYVLIHDSVRPFVTTEQINTCISQVKKEGPCALGVPIKDTIKIIDENNTILSTPDRNRLCAIQTPQAFPYTLIKDAYRYILEHQINGITDDTMAIERAFNQSARIIMGSYDNIKITTPEDLLLGEKIIQNRK